MPSILIDFDDESIELEKHLVPLLGAGSSIMDVRDICRLSIQDDVMRVLSGTRVLFVEEALTAMAGWLATDVLLEATELSYDLANRKLSATTGANTCRDIVWLSKTIGVVS